MSKSANDAGNAGVNFGSRCKTETELLQCVIEAIEMMYDAVKYMLADNYLCYKIQYETWMAEHDN